MTRYRVAVHIVPRKGVLDPQGKAVADALHALANDAGARARYVADRSGFAGAAGLEGHQAAALVAMDLEALAAMGVHPLVSFLANMQLEQGKKKSR